MKTFIKVFISILVFVVLATGYYAFYLYNSAEKAAEEMHYPIERETTENTKASIDKKDPLTFLLLGIDSKTSGKGRSDVMMAVTVNPSKKTVKLVSIPRDTRTTIVGKGFKDKINHSYAFGGPEMAIETVEEFLDIPVNHFVSINMWGFRDMVDAVGGVTVNNNLYFKQNNFTFEKGPVTLNGDQALAFVRHRKTDPKGDLGRAERQKLVIQAIIEKTIQNPSPGKMKELITAIGSNVRTDLTFDQMKTILSDYSGARGNVSSVHLKGSGIKFEGIYYYQVTDEERNRVSGELKKNLGLLETE